MTKTYADVLDAIINAYNRAGYACVGIMVRGVQPSPDALYCVVIRPNRGGKSVEIEGTHREHVAKAAALGNKNKAKGVAVSEEDES